MRPEEVDAASLQERQIGPLPIFFGYESGKYPWGNSLIHSHTHDDHTPGHSHKKQQVQFGITDIDLDSAGEDLPLLGGIRTSFKPIDGAWNISRHELICRGVRTQSDTPQ